MTGELDSLTPAQLAAAQGNANFETNLQRETIKEIEAGKRVPLVELFGPTVQGEGLVIGQRTLFLRFGLCDYKCASCDSMHAVDPLSVRRLAEWLTPNQILTKTVDHLIGSNCSWVTLSGGNPCIHDLSDLVTGLRNNLIGCAVETQGTFAPDWVASCDYITVSPKGPGMGEKFEIEKYQHFMAKFCGHPGLSTKVVVFDARDLEFASMIAEMSPTQVNSDRFYLSHGNPYPPKLDGSSTSGLVPQAELFESIERFKALLDDIQEYPSLKTARVLPQLHTWLWGNEKGR